MLDGRISVKIPTRVIAVPGESGRLGSSGQISIRFAALEEMS